MKKLQINRGLLVGFLSLTILLVPLHPAYPADVTLYDNMTGFNPSSYAFDTVYWYNNLTGGIIDEDVASSFSTGNFSGTLSSVVLLLHNPGGTVGVSIYGDYGGKPYGYVGRLWPSGTIPSEVVDGQPVFGRVTFTASGISLAPRWHGRSREL